MRGGKPRLAAAQLEGFNDVDPGASASGVVVVGGTLFVNARLFQFYDLWRKGATTDRNVAVVAVSSLPPPSCGTQVVQYATTTTTTAMNTAVCE